MDINRDNMDALFQTYNTSFHQGMQVANTRPTPEDILIEDIAMIGASSGAAAVHAWLNQMRAMREWIGDRLIRNIESGKLTITNKDYENTVEVPRNSILDDQYGLYTPIVGAMGTDASKLWMRLGIEAMIANGTWADDKPFFVADRKYGKQTINNLVTTALSAETYAAARVALESMFLHGDEPAEVVADILVVGPSLRDTAWNIVKNEWVSSGTGKGGAVRNPQKDSCRLGISRRLVGTYASDWFLLGTMGGMRSVYVQKREEPRLTRIDKDDDEHVFMSNKFLYGTNARGAAFLTLPHLAIGGLVHAA